VLGHEDVGIDGEVVEATGLLDDLFEAVFGRSVIEVGEATVAAKGDEVELARLLTALETVGHGGILAGVGESGSSFARMTHPCDEAA
jgi:hypothetical protein